MMRIAYVCADPGVPVFGTKGCSVHVQEVLRTFLARGFAVDLFAYKSGGVVPESLRPIRFHQLEQVPKSGDQHREATLIRANEGLHRRLQQEGPYDLVYERYSLWSWRAMEFAREHNLPGVLEANAPLVNEQAEHRELFDLRSAVAATKRAMAAASVVACVSTPVTEYARQYGATGIIQVVSNGVDPVRFFPRHNHVSATGPVTIGFVGSLRPWHAVTDLVDAFETVHWMLPNTRLLIVGDGPQRETLERRMGQLTAATRAAITMTGAIGPDEVPATLHAMDIAVAPYRPSANFYFSPLKLYEYMAAGLPVVASEIGQITGVVSDGHNGLFYPPGNTPQLVACLDQLARDPDLRTQLGDAARTTVLENHTWDAVVDQILALANVRNVLETTSKE